MSVSDQDMLDAIDTAILAILEGKMASTSKGNGASLTRLPIDKLQEMKRDYEGRVARANGTGCFVMQARNPE